jgi:hypothetical protein
MPATASRPDIHAFLDAYAVLEVEHAADPAVIRQAYKRLARQHHPDRQPAGSPEQQRAAERMTQINAAYQLIREAPLRHHRVSTHAQPDVPWADAELDAAIRRAHHERIFSNVANAAFLLLLVFGGPLLAQTLLFTGMSYGSVALAMIPFNILVMLVLAQGGGVAYLWRASEIAQVLLSFFSSR